MHLAYSAFRNNNSQPLQASARRQGYLAACHKHREALAAIQQYLPGWLPPLEAANGGSQWAVSGKQFTVEDCELIIVNKTGSTYRHQRQANIYSKHSQLSIHHSPKHSQLSIHHSLIQSLNTP